MASITLVILEALIGAVTAMTPPAGGFLLALKDTKSTGTADVKGAVRWAHLRTVARAAPASAQSSDSVKARDR